MKDRDDDIRHAKFEEFMGEQFQEFPLRTEHELLEEIKLKINNLIAFENQPSLKIMTSALRTNLEEIMKKYQNKNYIKTAIESLYREQYDAQHDAWINSCLANIHLNIDGE